MPRHTELKKKPTAGSLLCYGHFEGYGESLLRWSENLYGLQFVIIGAAEIQHKLRWSSGVARSAGCDVGFTQVSQRLYASDLNNWIWGESIGIIIKWVGHPRRKGRSLKHMQMLDRPPCCVHVFHFWHFIYCVRETWVSLEKYWCKDPSAFGWATGKAPRKWRTWPGSSQCRGTFSCMRKPWCSVRREKSMEMDTIKPPPTALSTF